MRKTKSDDTVRRMRHDDPDASTLENADAGALSDYMVRRMRHDDPDAGTLENADAGTLSDYMVRRMCEDDLDAAAFIEGECFSDPWSRDGFAGAIAFETNIFLVAQETGSGRIIGYCGVYLAADEGEITNVAVLPAYRKRGIASALLAELLTEAESAGAAQIFLEVRISNADAIALYKHYGFAVCGQRRNFYNDPKEDAYVMVRRAADTTMGE